MPSVTPGENHDNPDPKALRRTFAGFATRISGTATPAGGHCETRGRFIIERPGPNGLVPAEQVTDSLRDSTGTATSLGRRLENELTARVGSSPQANDLRRFLLQDRWKRRWRARYVQLLKGSGLVSGKWDHLGECPVERGPFPRIEPLPLRPGQVPGRAAEFPGLSVAPSIPLIAQSPAAALTRRALTTLLPSSSSTRRKSPSLTFVLHTVWLMVIDERELRACLILHVAFGLTLPPSLGRLDPGVKIPDFVGSLSIAALKKPTAYPYLHRILTLAIAKGMDNLCQMILLQVGFPRSLDDPIFVPNTGIGRKALPSYLLLAVGLRRCSLLKMMIDPSCRRSNSSTNIFEQNFWLGLTPLLVGAATGGKAAAIMVRALLEAGANPTMGINLSSMVVLQKLVYSPRTSPITVLDTRGPIKKVLPLDMACATESCDAVISIIGAMTRSLNPQPLSGCHLALLIQQDLDITIRLIKAGAPVKIAQDHEGSTPLHWAARRGKTEILAVLLHAGASIDAVNKRGWTALHEAAWHGHADAIKYLISRGADCSLPDHETGLTALQMALKSGIPSEDLCDYFGIRNHSLFPGVTSYLILPSAPVHGRVRRCSQ